MRQKIFLIVLGFLVSLLLFEIVLRLSGQIYYKAWMSRVYNPAEKDDAVFKDMLSNQAEPSDIGLIKIICVGDSFTFGAGTSPEYSYPAQLQRMLNSKGLEKFRVYNCGIPGCSSTKLLEYLPGFLKKYNPNIIIILIGQNDTINPYISELFLFSGGFKKYCNYLRNVINDLRIYKVLRFGLQGLSEYMKIRENNKSYIKKGVNPESEKISKIGLDLYSQGKIELARDYLEKSIILDPNNEFSYIYLGLLYSSTGKIPEALILFERLLEINPYSEYRHELYRHLFRIYQQDKGQRKKIDALVKRIPSDEKFKNPGMPFILSQEKIIKNLDYNLRKTIALIKSKRIKPILQTYPRNPQSISLNTVLSDISKEYKVPLVDNERSFKKIPYLDKYFVEGGHPNQYGYEIMAKNVLEIINKLSSGNYGSL